MTRHALAVALALVGLTTAAPVYAQAPGDGCSLLQVSDIQSLAGASKVGAGKASTDELGSRMCRYEWGASGNARSGRSVLSVSATLMSKAYPEMDPALVRRLLLGKASAGTPNTGVIPAVGDAATYRSDDPSHVQTTAMAKGRVLIVSFESEDARGTTEQVIALLKSALGRL